MPLATLSLPAPAAPPSTGGPLRPLVDAHAAMVAQADLHAACRALATALAQTLGFDRICIGVARGASVRLTGTSDTASPDGAPPPEPPVSAAMLEALDQRASVVVPEPKGHGLPRIAQAQRALLQGSGSVASVPMLARGTPVGALTAWRHGAAPITPIEIESLEYAAGLAAPVLLLMCANERPAWQRARDALLDAWAGMPGRHRFLRPALIAAAAVLAALALVPMEASVGGRARLEGAVQRVLVAPADGFLKQAHARPGDEVRAGQTLIEFAQQDLQLDRARWASQLEQQQNGFAGANARRDRAQLVINQSRAAEAEAQLALVDAKLERSAIDAPFDGVVVRGDLSQQIGAPVQQGAELMTIAPRDRFRVMVEVDERDIAAVRVGNAGQVTLSALPWDTLPLRVTRITPMATAVEGANVFEVEAELIGHPAELRPGLQGHAHIQTDRRPLLWSALHRLVDAVRLGLWKWFG